MSYDHWKTKSDLDDWAALNHPNFPADGEYEDQLAFADGFACTADKPRNPYSSWLQPVLASQWYAGYFARKRAKYTTKWARGCFR